MTTIDTQTSADPLSGIATRCGRLLLTGAGGNLGKVLRERLTRYADVLRLSDITDLGAARAGEEVVPCNLADAHAVDALVKGVDAIVHLGGISVERPFEEILPANIQGTYHLYETARRHGVKRIVFASSNHAIGFYRQGEVIDARVPTRPDGYYGLSKVFGEQLGSFYFDRYGIETVAIRIGSSFPEAKDRRMLVTWLGYDDLEQLIRRALFVPEVGFTIVYGRSGNRDTWWDNRHAAHLGYVPTQSSEAFRGRVEAQPPLAADDPAARFQGGAFVKAGPFGD
ncbi:NAD-dependent epimerase/dehydratase family protein [Ralstonia solanacearum]|uniref:NAD-dependent epimerase/dehydratase family protein n=1 Tax=Ralstonia solanacearum TaxID=305 RepID=UPI00078DD866|nr:NAD(P)-dependent oxidoreductase [Ralstonia solanacearum]AMP39808.1 NAD-dependent dehydratase [Ralstonia solanacearum]AXV88652.1 NAD(P)-dependent oxidoreductase [Ralstonia solanacearum]AXW08125.1 NAD(P)-dependent oxidoreductase [Ralstonia solanacearum]AXW25915.1 NAD(P)-dependent oxidoreductase [Ralstonia solanacearum]AXW82826.1 NAD(P)-dependent oxidoreductase [Ralstonia solanacearum]